MKWIEGRQKTGYEKLTIFISYLFGCDLYLLRFKEGSYIDPHVDIVDYKKHYRLNIILRKAKKGGEFICDNLIFSNSFIKLFRPDIEKHSVNKIEEGTRYVLSFGWVKK